MMFMEPRAFFGVLCLAALTIGPWSTVQAQQSISESPVVNEIIPVNKIDLRTPLSTTQGFMRYAEIGQYELAAEYLDLRYLPDELSDTPGAELAEKLFIIITLKGLVDFNALSNQPEGADDDGLPNYRDVLGEIPSRQGEQTIYLQLIPGKEDTQIWKISNSSVAQIQRLYAEHGYSKSVEYFRDLVPKGSFLGAEYFKWAIAILAGAGCVLIWFSAIWLLFRFLGRLGSAASNRIRLYLSRPIPTLLFILIIYYVLLSLGLGVTAQRIAQAGTLLTVAVIWWLFATTNLLRDLYGAYLHARGRDSGLMLLRPLASTAKVIIGTLALLVWLDNLGINVTALLAGLGVGGLAVALVLQRPLEDIMGAITLYTQQPVGIGQYCTCGDVTGTVEEINLRATRVRTIGNTVVVIPNAVFATASIENISERSRILHRQTVRLALDTSESTIRFVLERLREVLHDNGKIVGELSRVRLTGFGEFSIDIEVFAHISTTDWNEFLEIAEEINLNTVGALETLGAKLAEHPH